MKMDGNKIITKIFGMDRTEDKRYKIRKYQKKKKR